MRPTTAVRAVRRRINVRPGSEIIKEKSYRAMTTAETPSVAD